MDGGRRASRTRCPYIRDKPGGYHQCVLWAFSHKVVPMAEIVVGSRGRRWVRAIVLCAIVAGGFFAVHAYRVVMEARRFAAAQARAGRWGGFLAREVVMPTQFRSLNGTILDPLVRSFGKD